MSREYISPLESASGPMGQNELETVRKTRRKGDLRTEDVSVVVEDS